jgi:DUF971 family protein
MRDNIDLHIPKYKPTRRKIGVCLLGLAVHLQNKNISAEELRILTQTLRSAAECLDQNARKKAKKSVDINSTNNEGGNPN